MAEHGEFMVSKKIILNFHSLESFSRNSKDVIGKSGQGNARENNRESLFGLFFVDGTEILIPEAEDKGNSLDPFMIFVFESIETLSTNWILFSLLSKKK